MTSFSLLSRLRDDNFTIAQLFDRVIRNKVTE